MLTLSMSMSMIMGVTGSRRHRLCIDVCFGSVPSTSTLWFTPVEDVSNRFLCSVAPICIARENLAYHFMCFVGQGPQRHLHKADV